MDAFCIPYLRGRSRSRNINDVIAEAKLGINEHVLAIQKSEVKNSHYQEILTEVQKNPYTEVATIVTELIAYKKQD